MKEKNQVNQESDSQPGSQEAQRLRAESTTSQAASEPGSTPDNAEN